MSRSLSTEASASSPPLYMKKFLCQVPEIGKFGSLARCLSPDVHGRRAPPSSSGHMFGSASITRNEFRSTPLSYLQTFFLELSVRTISCVPPDKSRREINRGEEINGWLVCPSSSQYELFKRCSSPWLFMNIPIYLCQPSPLPPTESRSLRSRKLSVCQYFPWFSVRAIHFFVMFPIQFRKSMRPLYVCGQTLNCMRLESNRSQFHFFCVECSGWDGGSAECLQCIVQSRFVFFYYLEAHFKLSPRLF